MTADEVRQLLQLTPLELEGGFFRETYRSRWQVSAEYLPEGTRGPRSIGTAIYYMITPESFSTLHRLPGTEVFHFYMGDPVVMLQLHPDGTVAHGDARNRSRQRAGTAGRGAWQRVAGLQACAGRPVGIDGDDDVSGV